MPASSASVLKLGLPGFVIIALLLISQWRFEWRYMNAYFSGSLTTDVDTPITIDDEQEEPDHNDTSLRGTAAANATSASETNSISLLTEKASNSTIQRIRTDETIDSNSISATNEDIATDNNSPPKPSENSNHPTQQLSFATKNYTNNNNNNTTQLRQSFIRQSNVAMMTYVFGIKSVTKRRFRMFVESARFCGFDILLVGDSPPPFDLPPNVHFVNITWEGLIRRLYERVFGVPETEPLPKSVRRLLKVNFYKVCDYKPLFAYLFPEIVEGYEWWGHMDNDVVVGNLTKFFHPEFLASHDIISGDGTDPKHKAWGPFQLYRNIEAVNTLFQDIEKTGKPMAEIFLSSRYHYFDEWNNVVKKGTKYSMTGLIATYAHSRGLRHAHEPTGAWMHDKKACRYAYPVDNVPGRCGECVFDHGSLWHLTKHLPPITNKRAPAYFQKRIDREVFLCHYQNSKKMNQDASLENDAKFQQLVDDQAFRVAYKEGFGYHKLDARSYSLEGPRPTEE